MFEFLGYLIGIGCLVFVTVLFLEAAKDAKKDKDFRLSHWPLLFVLYIFCVLIVYGAFKYINVF